MAKKSKSASTPMAVSDSVSVKRAKAVTANSVIVPDTSTSAQNNKNVSAISTLTLIGATAVILSQLAAASSDILLASEAQAIADKSPAAESLCTLDQHASAVRVVQVVAQPFERVVSLLGLHSDSQGEHALVHALLHYAGHPVSNGNSYRSPCEEVLALLAKSGINRNALNYLRQYFETASEQYARRN